MMVLQERPAHVPFTAACSALGLNRSTVYARQRRGHHIPDPEKRSRKQACQPRALSAAEREALVDRMNRPEFWDQTAYQIYHTLLEQGECLGSLSTMYRVLREAGQSGERRDQRAPQSHEIPRLTATRPNEVWTWVSGVNYSGRSATTIMAGR